MRPTPSLKPSLTSAGLFGVLPECVRRKPGMGMRAGVRLAAMVALMGVALGGVGCASSSAEESRPLTGPYIDLFGLEETPRITLEHPEIGESLRFAEPAFETSREGAELVVNVTNEGAYRYGVTYRVYWYGEEGEELGSTRRSGTVRLGPGDQRQFRASTENPEVVDYRVHVDWSS